MIGAAFAALLAVKSVAHSGSTVHLEDFRAMVYVKSCSGEFVPIYFDEQLTMPLANPLVADKSGNFSYFTTSPYGKVIIDWGGKPVVMSNCPVPKPGETPAP